MVRCRKEVGSDLSVLHEHWSIVRRVYYDVAKACGVDIETTTHMGRGTVRRTQQ